MDNHRPRALEILNDSMWADRMCEQASQDNPGLTSIAVSMPALRTSPPTDTVWNRFVRAYHLMRSNPDHMLSGWRIGTAKCNAVPALSVWPPALVATLQCELVDKFYDPANILRLCIWLFSNIERPWSDSNLCSSLSYMLGNSILLERMNAPGEPSNGKAASDQANSKGPTRPAKTAKRSPVAASSLGG